VAGVAGAALVAAGAAAAQSTVEELTVLGHAGPQGHDTFSYRVGYADLDLRTEHGRAQLDKRIQITARYVCTKIAQQERAPSADPSCVAIAVRDGRDAARQAKVAAFRSTARWKPGPGWTPPPEI
jgi:UrcA family protein